MTIPLPPPTQNGHIAPPTSAYSQTQLQQSAQPAPAPAAPVAPAPAPAHPSLYTGSSQYRHWRFSPEQLAATRETLNAAAVKAIRDAFESDEPGSSKNISFLNQHEEHALVKLYVGKIPQLCGHFRFSEEVEATAMSYLKRFYLKNTVMDWHPKNVMLTALFLAAKTTNNPISLDDYTSNIPKTVPADVLDLEFLVAQSLGFEFAVWHAHRALWGARLDMETLPDTHPKQLEALYGEALKHVRASRLTDAELIYTPAQIALAAFAMVNPEMAERWAGMKGRGLGQGQGLVGNDGAGDVQGMGVQSHEGAGKGQGQGQSALARVGGGGVIPRIQTMIVQDGVGPDVEYVREVDRRLRVCKNPERVRGSKAWVKKEQEREGREREKRVKKAEEARKAMEADDVFGGALAVEGGEAEGVGGEEGLDDDD